MSSSMGRMTSHIWNGQNCVVKYSNYHLYIYTPLLHMWCFRWFGKKNKLLVCRANRVMVSCYVRRKSLQSSCKPFKIRMGVGFPITEMVMSSSPWLRKPPKCMKQCSFSKVVITAILLPRSFDGESGQQWIGQIDYNCWQFNGYNYTHDYRIRIIYHIM